MTETKLCILCGEAVDRPFEGHIPLPVKDAAELRPDDVCVACDVDAYYHMIDYE